MRIPGLLLLACAPLLAQTFSYDAEGRLIRAVYPQGGGVRYQYDSADNLLSVAPLSVPAAPANVQLTRLGPTRIQVSWNAVPGSTGYRVERRVSGGAAWEQMATTASNQLTFIDETALAGQQYDYRVVAQNADGTGAYSETASSADSGSGLPVISENGIVNAASFDPAQPIAPGSIVSIFGVDFGFAESGGQRSPVNATAPAAPWPIELAGHSVTIGGRPAPMHFVAGREVNGRYEGQINVQVPWQTPPGDAIPVVVRRGGSSPQESAPRNVRVAAVSPAAFTFAFGGGPAAIVNIKVSADDDVIANSISQPVGSLPGASTQPARRGGVISIYSTGLGEVVPVSRDGENSMDALRETVRKPRVLIGNVAADLLFSGLSPEFVGLYQINVRISPDTPAGDAIPVRIVFDESTSRGDVTLAIRP